MEPKIVLSTPGSVTIKSPRNMLTPGVKTTQEIYDIAQKHCETKSQANAVATKSWLQPFDGNYHEFECKKDFIRKDSWSFNILTFNFPFWLNKICEFANLVRFFFLV